MQCYKRKQLNFTITNREFENDTKFEYFGVFFDIHGTVGKEKIAGRL